jgi:hypothetical protein
MNHLQERVEALVTEGPVVSTSALVEALYLPNTSNRTNAIRRNLKSLGFDAEMIGYNRWLIK